MSPRFHNFSVIIYVIFSQLTKSIVIDQCYWRSWFIVIIWLCTGTAKISISKFYYNSQASKSRNSKMSTIPIPCCGSSFRLFFPSKSTFFRLWEDTCCIHIATRFRTRPAFLFSRFCFLPVSPQKWRKIEGRGLGDAMCKEYAVSVSSQTATL